MLLCGSGSLGKKKQSDSIFLLCLLHNKRNEEKEILVSQFTSTDNLSTLPEDYVNYMFSKTLCCKYTSTSKQLCRYHHIQLSFSTIKKAQSSKNISTTNSLLLLKQGSLPLLHKEVSSGWQWSFIHTYRPSLQLTLLPELHFLLFEHWQEILTGVQTLLWTAHSRDQGC